MSTITNESNLEYQYKIDPNGNSQTKNLQSNIVTTNLITPNLSMVKTVDKTYATIGDILNYTVNLTNNGNILLSNINFKDVLPSGATFVSGSVKVDNVSQPTYDITTGFNLGSMILLGTKTVTFQAEVTSLPTPNTIINKATTTFNYLIVSIITGNSQSNTVTTTVNVTNLSIVKSANVTDVEVGDELIYTIVITNNGNIDATNINFQDTLNPALSFVTGSVTINGTSQGSYNPNIGFTIPNMIPNATTTVVFEANVI